MMRDQSDFAYIIDHTHTLKPCQRQKSAHALKTGDN